MKHALLDHMQGAYAGFLSTHDWHDLHQITQTCCQHLRRVRMPCNQAEAADFCRLGGALDFKRDQIIKVVATTGKSLPSSDLS